jgi:hypothetical protein
VLFDQLDSVVPIKLGDLVDGFWSWVKRMHRESPIGIMSLLILRTEEEPNVARAELINTVLRVSRKEK